jgi:hypothetical protein
MLERHSCKEDIDIKSCLNCVIGGAKCHRKAGLPLGRFEETLLQL